MPGRKGFSTLLEKFELPILDMALVEISALARPVNPRAGRGRPK